MMEAGLYIHIPFCLSKCHYCAFHSRPGSRKEADGYVQVLLAKISAIAATSALTDYRFSTVFIGGGTPTLASPEALARLLTVCKQAFAITEDAEISLEANPNSVELAGLQRLRQAGFNRLSLGVQSFNNVLLRRLGRSHTAEQALQAVTWARQAGFNNLNLDLIYGLPGQTKDLWEQSLRGALELRPEHLALYELTIEEGTFFGQQPPPLPHEDEVADMEELSLSFLEPHYQRYEVSNYSVSGRQCRHNLNYWHNGDYLGIGAGAVSCLAGRRSREQTNVARYMVLVGRGEPTRMDEEVLDPLARFRETVIMGLRLVEGLSICELELRFGRRLQDVYGNLINELEDKGLVLVDHGFLRLPSSVIPVANQVLSQLV